MDNRSTGYGHCHDLIRWRKVIQLTAIMAESWLAASVGRNLDFGRP